MCIFTSVNMIGIVFDFSDPRMTFGFDLAEKHGACMPSNNCGLYT